MGTREEWEAQLVEERGEKWVEENRALLQAEWEFIETLGFGDEDDGGDQGTTTDED